MMAESLWILVVQNRADCTSSGAESEDHAILSTLKPFSVIDKKLNAVYILCVKELGGAAQNLF